MKVKDRDGNLLVEGNAVRQRWTEYYELLNGEGDVQASIGVVGTDCRMPVFRRLNGVGVESYEMEEGLSQMISGKTQS